MKAKTSTATIKLPSQKRATRRLVLTAPEPPELSPEGVTSPTSSPPSGKLGLLVELLSRPDGATIADLADATGWQDHSVRGALAGALRKRGYVAMSEKIDRVRRYRLSPPS